MKKYGSTFLLLALCATLPEAYFGADYGIEGHFLYHFTHANLFHLLSNFIFLAYFKPRWTTALASYFIASGASFMPFVGMSVPTCGMSGMCFAMIARHDVAWRVLNWRLLALNSVFILLPNVNWKLHFVSYFLSFILWKIFYLIKASTNQ